MARRRKNGVGFTVLFTGIRKKKPFARTLKVGGKLTGFGTRKEAEIARRITFRNLTPLQKKRFKIRTRIVKL